MNSPGSRPALRIVNDDDGSAASPIPRRIEFEMPGRSSLVLSGWTEEEWSRMPEGERESLPPVYRFGTMYVCGVVGDPGLAPGGDGCVARFRPFPAASARPNRLG